MRKTFITLLLLSLVKISLSQNIDTLSVLTTSYNMNTISEKIGYVAGITIFSDTEKLESTKLEIDKYTTF